MRPTRLDISLAAIVDNARKSRARINADALCAVIKADAYGHGAVAVAKALIAAKAAQMLAVALVEEALTLRSAGIAAPILVLGADYRGAEEAVVGERLSVALGHVEELERLAKAAAKQNQTVSVHLELDCGMARLGGSLPELVAVAEAAKRWPQVRIEGLMGHLTHADVPDAGPSRAQQAELLAAQQTLARALPALKYVHLYSSGALATLSGQPSAMARCGLALYGLNPVPSHPLGLTTALTWRTRAVAKRHLAPGTPVSYGGRWRAERQSTLLTLPVGYADGYPRILSQQGAAVLVRGQRAPVVGTICMDLLMVDVTDIPAASTDDEVVLLGRQGEEVLSAHELARLAGTIPYEIVSGIMPRVPRFYDQAHGPKKGSTDAC